MSAPPLKEWMASRNAAEARERLELRLAGVDSQQAIAQALALIALAGRLHGWPVSEDPVSARETASARDQWSHLYAALRPR